LSPHGNSKLNRSRKKRFFISRRRPRPAASDGRRSPKDSVLGQANPSRSRVLVVSSDRPLPNWTTDENINVRLVATFDEASAPNSFAKRASPVHPLSEDTTIPDLENGTWFVHFLVADDAFRVLGRISRQAYPGLETRTWFGIGLASLIIFVPTSDQIKPLSDDRDIAVVAREVWKIDRGILVNRRVFSELGQSSEHEQEPALPTIDSDFPPDLRGVIEEFVCSFAELRRRAQVYSPDELARLRFLWEDVRNIVQDLVWLNSDRLFESPEALQESDLTSSLERSRLIQQRAVRLVQINSVLSYLISQAFFGAPPVLSASALARN
jgi:hypothetical protein